MDEATAHPKVRIDDIAGAALNPATGGLVLIDPGDGLRPDLENPPSYDPPQAAVSGCQATWRG